MPASIRNGTLPEVSNGFNCVDCSRPDGAGNMVQCDKCDLWRHYSCADVDEWVKDVPWTCATCTNQQTQENLSSVSDLAESLARLRARQELERLQIDIDVQRRHTEEQQALISNSLGLEENRSRRSRVSSRQSEQRIRAWVDEVVATAGAVGSSAQQQQQQPSQMTEIAESLKAVPSNQSNVPNTRGSEAILPSPPLLPSVAVPKMQSTMNRPRPNLPLSSQASDRVKQLPNRSVAFERLSPISDSPMDAQAAQSSNSRSILRDPLPRFPGQSQRDTTSRQPLDLEKEIKNCKLVIEELERNARAQNAELQILLASSQQERLTADFNKQNPSSRSCSGAFPKATTMRNLPVPTNSQRTGMPVRPELKISDIPNNQNNPPNGQDTFCQRQTQSEGFLQVPLLHNKRPATKTTTNGLSDSYLTSRPNGKQNPGTSEKQFSLPYHTADTILAMPFQGDEENVRESRNVFTTPLIDEQIPAFGKRGSTSYNLSVPLRPENLPTQQQLAARQSLARDLPIFSGNPTEWPIFIANYRYTTEACGFTNGENMLRLQRSLQGQALDAVRSRLIFPSAIPQVIEILRMRYGRPEVLINVLLQKVRAIPPPRSDRLESLIEFGTAVQELVDNIDAANEPAHLVNPALLQELVMKLPTDQRMMWAGFRRSIAAVDLRTFGSYMAIIVEDASSVVVYEGDGKKSNVREKSKFRGTVFSHAEGNKTEQHNERPLPPNAEEHPLEFYRCAICEENGHRVRECDVFRSLPVDERWLRVRALRLCWNCLSSHGRRACRVKGVCGIDGCKNRHHTLLHSSNEDKANVGQTFTHRLFDTAALFRIIPVTLFSKDRQIATYAFLDEGSDLTLIESDLVSGLGIRGSPNPLCLRWTANTSRLENESHSVQLSISGIAKKSKRETMNARTVKHLGLPYQSFYAEEAAQKYDHLRGIPLSSYENAKPRMLIGLDNLRLAVPLKTREGNSQGPVAVKTRLGWCVYGPRNQNANKAYNLHVCQCSCDDNLETALKDFCALDNLGAQTEIPITKEDQRAIDILESTTKKIGNSFETGLLWKKNLVELPDSYPMAKRRLECFERRMEKNPALKENVHRQIREYELKGYAHVATQQELNEADPSRIWYLPIGAIVNPKKPGKVRVIWNAAAKVKGTSLNSVLLKGPDQLASLPAVLFGFRMYRVALTSDIREMFHQIKIRNADKHSQRFLWRFDRDSSPKIYLMDVATFGSTCSPASAQFVKNRNAEMHYELFPEASRDIISHHYVDDYLKSFSTEEEATKVGNDVRIVHGNGGFQLHNWRSNSQKVLEQLGVEDTLKVKELVEITQTERVLGMLWESTTDVLSFSTQLSHEVQNLVASSTRPTKRQVLRCVMILFDPLGLLAPFLIHGKVLIQDLWRTGIEWDDEVPDRVYERWLKWIEVIAHIEEIRIPRCYFPQATKHTYDNVQLHLFVDASEVAYACAIYLRTTVSGQPQCCLIGAKAKVAPLKPWSIPKLELQGCVLGVRLMTYVKQHHEITISSTHIWTDSRTALAWIKADPRNYRPFVSNRVGEILEHTEPSQWRWVPSRSNPADEATKWGVGPFFDRNSQWFNGPHFLQLTEEDWPKPKEELTATTEEMRASVLHHRSWKPVIIYEKYASWEKLQRVVAYVLRYIHNRLKLQPGYDSHLQQHELKSAEENIIQMVQFECFSEEIDALKEKSPDLNPITEKSPLYKLAPTIDDRGLLRQTGRIGAAKEVPYDTKFPVILPGKHYVTELLVDHFHRKFCHRNSETIVNELRQVYEIPNLRVLVKSIGRKCLLCQIRRTRPVNPPMAPLPPARLAHHERAFTYTGLDYFGPLLVKIGRANVKRWIALFTCLTTRAVHLEVAYSLTTASCISTVRRFVGRRGAPAEFYSDNGTNFQGAERILRHQISQGLSETFTSSDTKWSFIPPGAPHMGGAWERLVQSVKAAMNEAYCEGKLDDEGLQTLIVEAERIVNTRPLTYLPLDSSHSEALTPNHFLLLNSNGKRRINDEESSRVDYAPKTVDFEARRSHLGASWDLIQRQLETFWKRWLTEYLPVIRRQSKWFEKARQLEAGDLVLVTDPTKRCGWERDRVDRVLMNDDGQVRRAVVQIGKTKHVRPVTRLALLDVKGVVPRVPGIHPGENVAAANEEMATL
ncbi:uncharacterized protein LOC129738158 [Uranotaenia lowii]|uniref:uncharacterized protein LOC129738158 n=1 Tax=Uranotaenia lowii TaxID=190385 RepID=UPI00247B1E1B|nr:uncharacterized protein LOC129738158 [Uranotaenia lowii]